LAAELHAALEEADVACLVGEIPIAIQQSLEGGTPDPEQAAA